MPHGLAAIDIVDIHIVSDHAGLWLLVYFLLQNLRSVKLSHRLLMEVIVVARLQDLTHVGAKLVWMLNRVQMELLGILG